MLLIPIVLIVALVAGIREWNAHKRHISALPIRVNVNGIRGKSTVTRLITGIIKEAGYKTIGKTTGTSARLIYWDTPEEEPILRRPEGPNIHEQKMVMKKAVDLGAEALVSECMAVNPDYQIVFQEKLVQANIGVIVNVLEDHMDVMGPTLDEVAEAFTATIPRNGHLILAPGPYVDYFKREAARRNTEVIMADNRKISEAYLRKFDYMLFPENASLALAVAGALGIDEETAYRGMLNAQPDPGAMRIKLVREGNATGYFVNGFAANDPSSTINIWKRIESLGYPTKYPIILMNCREDRVDRTIQFADDVLPNLPVDTLILIGEKVDPIRNAIKAGRLEVRQVLDLEGKSTDEIYHTLFEITSNNVIYGIGNVHGAAEPLIEKLQK
jgi:poly-gamma-glutamate synthase PgsB/CapB